MGSLFERFVPDNDLAPFRARNEAVKAGQGAAVQEVTRLEPLSSLKFGLSMPSMDLATT